MAGLLHVIAVVQALQTLVQCTGIHCLLPQQRGTFESRARKHAWLPCCARQAQADLCCCSGMAGTEELPNLAVSL